MDVIIIFNGLGNQMSQYSFYLQKSKISKSTRFIFSKKSRVIHNGYELDNVFGIKYRDTIFNKILYLLFLVVGFKKIPLISKPVIGILNFMGVNVINENDEYNFKPEYLVPSRGIKFYIGGWHSEKYFRDIDNTVRRTFQFDLEKLGEENKKVWEKIKMTNSISVHVRRGDFLDPHNYNKLGGVCTINYYLFAIEKMKSMVDKPHFFFFTNDISWVKDNFTGNNFTMIDLNAKTDSWKDMFLISRCTHHINSNGSFSWWSAWLNKSENQIVIVPRNFVVNRHFEDIYPEHWIQLSNY